MGIKSLQSTEAFFLILISSEYTKGIYFLLLQMPYSYESYMKKEEEQYLGREVMVILQYLL